MPSKLRDNVDKKLQSEETESEDILKQNGKEAVVAVEIEEQPPKTKFRLQGWGEISLARKIIAIAFGLLFLWCLLPVFFGIHGIGVISSSLIMLCISAAAYLWNMIEVAHGLKARLIIVFAALIASAGAIAFCFVSGLMIKASITTVPEDCGNYTLVVLGCKTIGDEPSWMLEDRLDKAYEEMIKNPDIMCVVTGGQGEDETYTEAYVMKKYLTERGISADRIITEDSSTDTQENMLYTNATIKLNGLSQTIVIVTDRFHELRARIWAEKAGFKDVYSACCDTKPYLVIGYWFREMFGLARLYVFGY